MTLCQRLCVQQVIEVATWKEKEWKLCPIVQLEIKFQLNWNDNMVPCRQSATAPTLCSPRWATRTRTPTWRDRASWPRSRATWCLSTTPPAFWSVNKFQIFSIFQSPFYLIIWLGRATLDFDVGDNTCKSCGPACREEDYEKLVTTFFYLSRVHHFSWYRTSGFFNQTLWRQDGGNCQSGDLLHVPQCQDNHRNRWHSFSFSNHNHANHRA